MWPLRCQGPGPMVRQQHPYKVPTTQRTQSPALRLSRADPGHWPSTPLSHSWAPCLSPLISGQTPPAPLQQCSLGTGSSPPEEPIPTGPPQASSRPAEPPMHGSVVLGWSLPPCPFTPIPQSVPDPKTVTCTKQKINCKQLSSLLQKAKI